MVFTSTTLQIYIKCRGCGGAVPGAENRPYAEAPGARAPWPRKPPSKGNHRIPIRAFGLLTGGAGHESLAAAAIFVRAGLGR